MTEDALDAVEAIEDALFSIPRDQRLDVLAEVTRITAADLARPRFRAHTLAELSAMTFRPQRGVMKIKSLIVQRFVRDITNNASPRNAAKILFQQHKNGTGSGRLLDYIGDLVANHKETA